MFTLAICAILNGYTQVNIKILLIQTYHTTRVPFSCQFILIETFMSQESIPELLQLFYDKTNRKAMNRNWTPVLYFAHF